jgi:hypothetical protein
VLLHPNDPLACAVDKATAQPTDPLLVAAERSEGSVTGIDLTDYFCDTDRCYAVVGGVPVYFDADHLNRRYAELLAPYLAQRLAG